MTRQQVKELLDRVLSWPPERQADLAEVARLMEQQDRSRLGLTKEHAAEVERRLADKNSPTLTLAELNGHLRKLRCMKVVLRRAALEDLDSIYAWISKDNPKAAADMVARIRDRISLLEIDSLAQMGRPGWWRAHAN